MHYSTSNIFWNDWKTVVWWMIWVLLIFYRSKNIGYAPIFWAVFHHLKKYLGCYQPMVYLKMTESWRESVFNSFSFFNHFSAKNLSFSLFINIQDTSSKMINLISLWHLKSKCSWTYLFVSCFHWDFGI